MEEEECAFGGEDGGEVAVVYAEFVFCGEGDFVDGGALGFDECKEGCLVVVFVVYVLFHGVLFEFVVEFVDVGVLCAEDLAICGAVCAVFEEVFFVFCG